MYMEIRKAVCYEV